MTGFGRVSAYFLIAVSLTSMLVSCKTTGDTTNKQLSVAQFKLGVSQLTSNNLQAAFLKFQESINLDPDNKEAHNALGVVYMGLDDTDNAEISFKNAISVDDEYSESYNNLCFIYYNRQQYDKAIKNCEKALKNPMYPTPDKAYYNLGRTYYRMGNFEEAAKKFNSALKRAPLSYQLHYGIALAYNAMKQYGRASEAMTQAVTLDPRFKGDKKAAEKHFASQKEGIESPKDLSDYIDILHY